MTGPAPVLTGPGPAIPGDPGAATAALAGPGGPGPAGPAAPPPRGVLSRWRAPLTVLALVLLGGIVIALLTPSPPTTGYLDPGNPGSQGTRALAALLAQRGQPVIRADSVTAALAAARAAGTSPGEGAGPAPGRPAGPGRAPELVITSPYLLSPGQLGELARVPGNLMVVEPDNAVLAAVNGQTARAPASTRPPGSTGSPGSARPPASTGSPGGARPSGSTGVPRVTVAGADEVRPVRPGCTLAAATAAGDAAMGGVLMRVRDTAAGSAAGAPGGPATGPAAGQCYRVDGHASLVRYLAGGRTVTLLGSGVPLTNTALAHRGNAALALNLLRGSPRIVWLVPSPAAPPRPGRNPVPGDPRAGLPGDGAAVHRRGARRTVAHAAARPAGRGAASGGGPRVGDRGGPRPASTGPGGPATVRPRCCGTRPGTGSRPGSRCRRVRTPTRCARRWPR